VYFPRLVMPLASIVSSLIKFGIQFSLFVVVYLGVIWFQGYRPHVGWALLYIPMALALLAGIGFGFGIIVSSLTTKYRDIGMLVGFGMQLLMYATPIVYSFTSVSPELKKYLSANPLVAPVESFKYALFGVGEFSIYTLLYSFTWLILLLITGLALFNRAEQSFMDTV
jgi:lipopolysaccharide transport system permease protein